MMFFEAVKDAGIRSIGMSAVMLVIALFEEHRLRYRPWVALLGTTGLYGFAVSSLFLAVATMGSLLSLVIHG